MKGFILAIEKAFEFGWCNLWVETESMYAVNLYMNKTSKIPWRMRSRWLRAVDKADKLNLVISHICREGNNVADKLASQASSSQLQNWWMHIPDSLASLAYRDHIGLPFYRFSCSS